MHSTAAKLVDGQQPQRQLLSLHLCNCRMQAPSVVAAGPAQQELQSWQPMEAVRSAKECTSEAAITGLDPARVRQKCPRPRCSNSIHLHSKCETCAIPAIWSSQGSHSVIQRQHLPFVSLLVTDCCMQAGSAEPPHKVPDLSHPTMKLPPGQPHLLSRIALSYVISAHVRLKHMSHYCRPS